MLWILWDSERLGPEARRTIGAPNRQSFVSAATIWELALKRTVGKLRVEGDLPQEVQRSGMAELPVTPAHAEATLGLPLHHKDPFDRMLIAQARTEGLTVVTHDQAFRAYDVALLMV